MSTQPSIIITRLDLQRLERLLDELEDFGPGAQALESELARAPAKTGTAEIKEKQDTKGKENSFIEVYKKIGR